MCYVTIALQKPQLCCKWKVGYSESCKSGLEASFRKSAMATYQAAEHLAYMDVTNYLVSHRMTANQLAVAIMENVLQTTGITATAGIGTNLYLAKIAKVFRHAAKNKTL